ncbi:unnamed protein product [Effrenium voratum]|uniref:Carboxylic ester hydrolase n=1 Tax=Effrenium voratum TaxID=2562239 RepID=A0AA36IT51_9DINO|nr:unnamed protein product [Effrenium voratum]CAJ1412647.1 unnamed protein product [Effrenium voratum]
MAATAMAKLYFCLAPISLGQKAALVEGPVEGSCELGVCEFLGLRYASPPLEDLRWSPPKPLMPWKEPRQAKSFGANCMQVKNKSIIGNEDCLFLNVWAPEKCPDASCTVMVWFHGGSYVTGGTKDMFNGSGLVRLANVILVTVNYRLGILGFAGSESLRSRAEDGSTGNYGIQDQRAALEWVHRNIAAFGGNTSDVCLFGESAGAGAIAVHLTSPSSWPLYSRVMMQSGAFSYWNAQPMEDAEIQFRNLLDATGCPDTACLLQMPGDALTGLATVELNPEPLPEGWKAYGTFFSPTVDGVVLKALPWQLLKEGRFNRKVAVLLGFNRDEGTVLASCEGTPKCAILQKGGRMTESDFRELLTTDMFNVSHTMLPTILQMYAPADNADKEVDWYWTTAAIYGDYAINCPTLRAADWISNMSEKDTFLYRFAHTPKAPAPHWAGIFGEAGTVGASHAAELGFVWLGLDGWEASRGAAEGGWPLRGKEEWQLAKTMATYWTNFAKTGSPNRPANVTDAWPPLPSALQLALHGAEAADLAEQKRRCALVDRLGPMVEGYTQSRRLQRQHPDPELAPPFVLV